MWASAGRNPATSQTPYLESEMSEHQEQMEPIIMLERMAKGQDATLYPEQRDAIKCLLDRIKELEQQRDAALKLADKWEAELGGIKRIIVRFAISDCVDELRAIFEPKEGKGDE